MTTSSSRANSKAEALVLVGTTKGAFIFSSDRTRARWRMDGPHFRGESVYAIAFDGRGGRQRLLAATRSFHWGSIIRTSDDFGRTWSAPDRQNVRFPADSGLSLVQVWQICPGPVSSPDLLYAGVEPAALFESHDAGDTWNVSEGLLAHEHRPKWQPGGGGLCLHTIVTDPSDSQRLLVAISTGGVYRTDDGGASWRPRNVGVRAEFLPEKYPEYGQCVHKVVHHPGQPGRLYLQNHWGLYRTDDWGDSWTDMANGVPSDFGFAMASHPRDPASVYIVPLESDLFRCVPKGKLRVYRTRDAGASWTPKSKGLPQRGAFETVLRDSLTTDTENPAGIYFGTRNGKLFGSSDEGESWRRIADGLPSIVCVKAVSLGGGAA
jgi:hypothetical protein